ncbi:cytochrome P450 2K1-like isoform X2 [Dendropsophus ebraccatus]|uniref:cytochrome P450 2K1-like isoform X2 n=1 Tax=Dendropsophus ebraccatus TaxID=150705 RepID=UPI003831DF59
MAFITYFLTRVDVLLFLSACFAIFIYWMNGSKKSKAKMPPGPTPLPLIGNLNMVDLKKPHQSLMKLSEKYGEVFTVHFGPKKVVVLAGYKAVKEALITRAEDFGERASSPLFDLTSNKHGIVFSNGEKWKSMRRFALSTLRDFGMGKKTMEAKIQDELVALIEQFKFHNGKPFDTHKIINYAVSNVISSIIFGKRFEYDDPTFQNLVRIVDENAKLAGTPKVMLFSLYPVIGALFGLHKKVKQNIQDAKSFVLKCVKKRRLEYDANDIAGYIDAYFMKQKQESTKTETYFDEENLIYSVLDLFGAGTETTSTTIRWGILLMMKYPEIQTKIQDEIKKHLKPGQLPSVEVRKKMPYTDAVVHEIQRFANIVPMNLPHMPPTDVYFHGYCIPKGTEIIPFLTSVLFDKTQWKTPYDFNPNHFLDDNGKFVRHDAFMPFSAGKRACAGESLAKMELFLFFIGLLQAFTFHLPPGVSREDLNLKPGIGFILAPTPYMTCAKPNY